MEEINKNLKLGYEHSTKEYVKLLEQIKKLEDAGINVKTGAAESQPTFNIELMPDKKPNLWNFGIVKKGLPAEIFKSDVETSYVIKMTENNIPVLQKTITGKPYYTCDGKPVETMEEVMNYNQYYYDKMMKSSSEKQKRK